ncbi:hypothetical protein [Teredinibacter purpureus]|uniref:hypothetical protein n=1 Tax=Teredinibacter purpureus TaxID=2731756 RepID=UPI0005F871AF|nr:hypothetical protein [Teredinibacter purpureus]
MIKNILLENLSQPEVLEEAYHSSPQEFESQLKEALENNYDSETLRVWDARLSYFPPVLPQRISVGLLVLFCLVAVCFAKLPSFLPIDGDWFYPRFIPIVVISAVISYFIKTTESSSKVFKVVIVGISASSIYLAILPESKGSASITMALVHLPMFSLSLMAASFMGDNWRSVESRLNFIRYLGEMGIYSILILLGGMVLTGITLGLFSLIGLSIEQWYMEYVVVLGLISTPLVATYLFDSIQKRQGKFASILSNVFSPLFLITVIAYLLATLYQGKSPFTDREFLITFNGLLVVILALTILSISGKKRAVGATGSDYINVSLIGATLLVNVVALSAILFRWAEYGITVNRVVVAGANLLIFIHLILLLSEYIGHIRRGNGLGKLEVVVAKYLPVYTLWSLIVAVLLPMVFWFK